MPDVVLRGLVLRTADYKESSRMLTVLTDSMGKLSVAARGATRMKSRIAAACQPMAFSEMTLSESRERYYLKEASTMELFSGLTTDLKRYALGCYFLELLDAACPETVEEPEALTLGLNALWLLAEGKKEARLIKTVLEWRLMSLMGYQPEVNTCQNCGTPQPDNPVLDLRGGGLYCWECGLKAAQRPKSIGTDALQGLRYLLGAVQKKAFSFSLEAEALKQLSSLGELYVREQLERSFSTLDYYKGLD